VHALAGEAATSARDESGQGRRLDEVARVIDAAAAVRREVLER